MQEYGIFNDESEDYTADNAVEAGFYSLEEAMKALEERYSDSDDCYTHECEEPKDEDDWDDDDGWGGDDENDP